MDGTTVLDALPAAEPRLVTALARLLQPVDDPREREIGDLALRSAVTALRLGRDDPMSDRLVTMAERLAQTRPQGATVLSFPRRPPSPADRAA